MTDKGRKIIKSSVLAIVILAIVGFALNWYLTYRLQSILKDKLSDEVYKATDGFYQCTFDDLSIGLFTGELSIRGVKLAPDSVTFTRWRDADSLPRIYYKVDLGEIHFKGINLTWRRSYKNLNFSLFELKEPNIEIVQPFSASKEDSLSNKELGTLYEIVSPYINKLTVKRINFDKATILYLVEDAYSPTKYQLRNASFKAYNFLLDEDSSISGKLLYCDDFEFEAKDPQQLLYSDAAILETDNIRLSTIQSEIKIEGVKIHPKESYWENRMSEDGGYLKADIGLVEVQGVEFTRKAGKNYLNAGSFTISSTDIQYFSVNKGNDSISVDIKNEDGKNDSVGIQDVSLYGLLSPILNSVSIDKIGIENTRFGYALTQDGYTDIYTLNQFDFHANKFLIDSLSVIKKKFWYVDNFLLVGNKIEGQINSNNSNVSVAHLLLDTEQNLLNISDIQFKPISVISGQNYLSGGVKQINVDGLDYEDGISAEQLLIDSVNLSYYNLSKRKTKNTNVEKSGSMDDILDIFSSYSKYLSVKDIRLKNANLSLFDKRENDTYRLKDLNFYATEFLFSDSTRQRSKYLFTCEDVGLSFRDFNNLIPGSGYRLRIDNADISTLSGKMRLDNVKLIPVSDSLPVIYRVETPLIEITGFDDDRYVEKGDLKFSDLTIKSPNIQIEDKQKTPRRNTSNVSSISEINALIANKLNITSGHLLYKSVTKDLSVNIDSLYISSVKWDISEGFALGSLILQSPEVYYIEKQLSIDNNRRDGQSFPSYFGKNIKIERFVISEPKFEIEQPNSKLNLDMELFSFSDFNWKRKEKNDLSLGVLNIIKPTIDFRMNKREQAKSSKSSGNFFGSLKSILGNISINEFNLVNVKADYFENDVKTYSLGNLALVSKNISFSSDGRPFAVNDFNLSATDVNLPVMNRFYQLSIKDILVDKGKGYASIDDIKMKSVYPKMEFAYKHPAHKDWFDVSVGGIDLLGLSFDDLVYNKLKANRFAIKDVVLQNFKNQQIEIEHNVMPLIYEKIQNLPMKLDISEGDVSNFSVIYEELPKKGAISGKITFSNMNAKILGLTNVPTRENQYIQLDVDGVFMNGPFTARWDIPVSPYNDCFILEAQLDNFDMRNLNEIFVPLAKAEVKSGQLNSFSFRTEATSEDASASMLFLYNDLKLTVLKDAQTEEPNKFLSRLANLVIKKDNPNKNKTKPRKADYNMTRDPYHSTFNYFWQILQPGLVESAGISQGTQSFVKKASNFFAKIKGFFSRKRDEEEKDDKGN